MRTSPTRPVPDGQEHLGLPRGAWPRGGGAHRGRGCGSRLPEAPEEAQIFGVVVACIGYPGSPLSVIGSRATRRAVGNRRGLSVDLWLLLVGLAPARALPDPRRVVRMLEIDHARHGNPCVRPVDIQPTHLSAWHEGGGGIAGGGNHKRPELITGPGYEGQTGGLFQGGSERCHRRLVMSQSGVLQAWAIAAEAPEQLHASGL